MGPSDSPLNSQKSLPNHRNLVHLIEGGLFKNAKGDTEALFLMELCNGEIGVHFIF